MPVSDKHAEYTKHQPQWKLVKDCVEGSAAIKKAGVTYLPKPNSEDTDNKTAVDSRYLAYKLRANFVNFTNHTKKGMVGMVFRKDTILELQTAVDYIETNANGGGLTFDQMTRDILANVLESGRYGLLIDYPPAEENLTQQQVKAQKLQANILPYNADEIINWRTTVVGGIKKLSLVVIAEDHENIAEDGFGVDSVKRYRALILENGLYVQRIYNEGGEQVGEDIEPKNSAGARWDEIPFIFVGAQNNDETVDDAPLYDLAEVNIGHYRNSADYEESSFMVGQATPVVSGISITWAKEVMKGKVPLGSRASILLPEGGSASLLQADANTQPLEGMKEKELQMVKIGARVIQDNSGQETAEAAKIRFSGQNSELATIVGNIEDAMIKALEWVGMFMGSDGENKITINREFYSASLGAQEAMALIQFADRGDISQEDIRKRLKKSGWLDEDRDSKDIDSENEETGFNLDGDGAIEGELLPKGSKEGEEGLANKNGTTTGEPGATGLPAPGGDIAAQNQAKLDKILAALEGGNGDITKATDKVIAPVAPTITIEAPITVNLPENMVSVVVEKTEVTVEAAQASPLGVTMESPDKDIRLVYNSQGVATGAESRAVKK